MSETVKRRVAVLGGGQAALTAALQLTDPANPAAASTEVTIYQLGWRLGGKGATGRPATVPQTILEHGLHQWFGFYDNTFSQIRTVYAENARKAGTPLATFEEAFVGADTMYCVEWIEGKPLPWRLRAPVAPGEPGVGGPLLTPTEYLEFAIELLCRVFASSPLANLSDSDHHLLRRAHEILAGRGHRPDALSARMARHLLDAATQIAGSAARNVVHPVVDDVHRVVRDLEREVPEHFTLPAWMRDLEDDALGAICALLALFMTVVWSCIRDGIATTARTEERRVWILLNFGYGCITGAIRARVLEKGFDTLNDVDFRRWLTTSAFPDGDVLMESPIVETAYVAAFAYPRGDTRGPLDFPPHENMEAGTMVRGAARMMLTYKGHLCYRFAAGTGDTAYAPVYEVLRKRGVNVRFFSRVERLDLDDGRIARVHVAEQAKIVDGAPYDPLMDVDGLPCWPVEPCWRQVVDADWFQAQDADFEWPSEAMLERERHVVLEHGRDYDDVVLGISQSGLPAICGDLIEAYPAWRSACDAVKTVRTQSLQLWLTQDAVQLGFGRIEKQSTGWRYDEWSPLGAWNDFSELIDYEHWPADRRPRNLSYFTSTMPDYDDEPPLLTQTAANERVRRNALEMLRRGLPVILPNVLGDDGDFRWDLLVDPQDTPHAATGPDRLATQWIRGNVVPTERYVLSVVDSSRNRLPVHDAAGPTNLYLAGDWTQCVLNCGCMEAATISGMLCSSALSGYPARAAIAGLDF